MITPKSISLTWTSFVCSRFLYSNVYSILLLGKTDLLWSPKHHYPSCLYLVYSNYGRLYFIKIPAPKYLSYFSCSSYDVTNTVPTETWVLCFLSMALGRVCDCPDQWSTEEATPCDFWDWVIEKIEFPLLDSLSLSTCLPFEATCHVVKKLRSHGEATCTYFSWQSQVRTKLTTIVNHYTCTSNGPSNGSSL